MELTDKEIQLLAQLSRNPRLYVECKGAGLDALQELGLPQCLTRVRRLRRLNKIRVHS